MGEFPEILISDANAGAGVPLPSPAETCAIAQESLQEAFHRKHCPASQGLSCFLRGQGSFVTGKGDDRTNIIDQGARVTYAFPKETIPALFDRLEAVRRAGVTSHFSERQGTPSAPASGLMLDYDLIIAARETRLLDRHVLRIAYEVVNLFQQTLVFPAGDRPGGLRDATLHVFSIVKPEPVVCSAEGTPEDTGSGPRKEVFKYGFHILVPGVWISRGYKKYLLRNLRESPRMHQVLSELGVVGDPRECLDMNSASVPVLFLGSCKRGGIPYTLGPAFEISFEAAFGGAGETPAKASGFPMPKVMDLPALEAAGYNLLAEASLCFEAQYSGGRAPLVPAIECACRPEIAAQAEDTRSASLTDDELLIAEHSLSTLAVHDPEARYLHQLLDLLDESYYNDRNKWRDVIFALANTSETYRPLAEWFSQKYYKWAAGTSKRVESFSTTWEGALSRRRAMTNPLTRRSIIRWAMACDPQRFRQISDQNYFSVLTKYVYDYDGLLEHAMVAHVLYEMLGSKFVVDIDEGVNGRYSYCWFEFVVPGQTACVGEVWKWRKEVQPDEVQNYISRNLVKVFDQVAQHIAEQREEAGDEGRAKYYGKLAGSFMVSRRKIFNDGFKAGIIKQAGFMFRRRGFVDSLDTEPLMIGTGNGVLRLGASCTLIDHFHEYPIMKYTPVVYRRFDPADPWTRLMLDALADIVPEPDFRDWLLFFAASSLAGGVKEGILLLWNGGGANGKTFFMRMVAKALGRQYAKKLNIAVLTSERESADRPNSAVMQLKGIRWGYVEETQKAEPLNSQRLKELVNPGEISGRDLHSKQENFEVTANIAVGQNYDFVIDTTDHGTWRRLKHYRSKVKFCANPTPGNPFEKKEDQRYVREYSDDPDCQAAFFSILVHYYERLQREYGGELKRVVCPTLERETEVFRNSQDTINRFITEDVVQSPNGGYEYPLTAVSGFYRDWYAVNISRRIYVASESIQDLENSSLEKFMKRAANKTVVLTGCRILTDGNRTLAPDESFMGVGALEEEDADPSAAAASAWNLFPKKADWWMPPMPSGAPTAAVARGKEIDEYDEFDLGRTVRTKKPRGLLSAQATTAFGRPLISDDVIEEILAQSAAGAGAGAGAGEGTHAQVFTSRARYTAADVFGDDEFGAAEPDDSGASSDDSLDDFVSIASE